MIFPGLQTKSIKISSILYTLNDSYPISPSRNVTGVTSIDIWFKVVEDGFSSASFTLFSDTRFGIWCDNDYIDTDDVLKWAATMLGELVKYTSPEGYPPNRVFWGYINKSQFHPLWQTLLGMVVI